MNNIQNSEPRAKEKSVDSLSACPRFGASVEQTAAVLCDDGEVRFVREVTKTAADRMPRCGVNLAELSFGFLNTLDADSCARAGCATCMGVQYDAPVSDPSSSARRAVRGFETERGLHHRCVERKFNCTKLCTPLRLSPFLELRRCVTPSALTPCR